MTYAIFDLDDTLLDGDSDYLWGTFLSLRLSRDLQHWKSNIQRFDHQYRAGEVNIDDYLEFSMRTLLWDSKDNLLTARDEFRQQWIMPRITKKALSTVEQHKQQGHTIVIATATNRFVAQAAREIVGAEYLCATEPQQENGKFNGKHEKPACFSSAKIGHLENLFGSSFLTDEKTWFYSDSINDLPLLDAVDHPCVVNPDLKLQEVASERAWPVMRWRRSKA